MIRETIFALGISLIAALVIPQPTWAQPELVSMECDQTITEAASCPGPFVICSRQYVIEVLEGATKLTIEVRPSTGASADWDLDLFVNRGAPVDQNNLDATVIAFSDAVGPDSITLSGRDLLAGTYYIAVGNPLEAPQPFELTVTLDPCRKCSEEQQRAAQNALPLEPNRIETGTVAAAATGSSSLAAQQYVLEITKNTKAVAIGLRSDTGGNIDLHIQIGCALGASSEGVLADYSLVSPVGFEFIFIKGAQLKPGTYYLAVENRENTEQQYSLAAAAVPMLSGPFRTDGSSDGRVETQGQGLLAFLQKLLNTQSGTLALTQYVLEVESSVKAIHLALEGSGPLHLHVRYEKPVEIENGRVVADLSSLGSSGVKSISLGGALLKPGKYYVAIEGLTAEPQDFILSFSFVRDETAKPVTKRYANPPSVKDLISIEQ